MLYQFTFNYYLPETNHVTQCKGVVYKILAIVQCNGMIACRMPQDASVINYDRLYYDILDAAEKEFDAKHERIMWGNQVINKALSSGDIILIFLTLIIIMPC